MLRHLLPLLVLLGAAAATASTDEEDTCADYVIAWAREGNFVDAQILSAISQKADAFNDLVTQKTFRLLGSAEYSDALKPSRFFNPSQVSDPRDSLWSFIRFFRIAVQRELDATFFGKYSTAKYKSRLSGNQASSGMVLIFWPPPEELGGINAVLRFNTTLEEFPRVLIGNTKYPAARSLHPHLSRVVLYDGGEFPAGLNLAPRAENGVFKIYVMGGPCNHGMGKFLSDLVKPLLEQDEIDTVEIILHSEHSFVTESPISLRRVPLRSCFQNRMQHGGFCVPLAPLINDLQVTPSTTFDSLGLPRYQYDTFGGTQVIVRVGL